jgi:hypothetical protein
MNNTSVSQIIGVAAFLVVAPFSCAANRPAAAQTPALGFTANAYGVEDTAADAIGSASGSFSLGFEFTADMPGLVTSLGFFNNPGFDARVPFNTVSLAPLPAGSRTFADSHQVGLYQIIPSVGGLPATNLLLASATVTAAGIQNGDFLYQSLTTPVLLVAGGDYVLAGVTGPSDPYVFDVQDPNTAGSVGLTTSGITYVQNRYAVSSTLTLPVLTDPGSEPGFFGPNFLSAPVPEAPTTASLGLLLLGLAGLTVRRRARKADSR